MNMLFDRISFIKSADEFQPDFTGKNKAPLFRRRFCVETVGTAKLYVCGLGYAYYYINGQAVSEDLFTAPVSDYRKTLWYNTYDVTGLLRQGENVIAVICGNGWYNEEFSSDWKYNTAQWRDQPKFIMRLDIDGETVLISDSSWKCCPDSATYFNALRSGEYFDAGKYDPLWVEREYNDDTWEYAVEDDIPPKGIFRECKCEPIRALALLKPEKIIRVSDRKQVLDFGRNISGFIRLDLVGEAGDEVIIRYAEQLKEDHSRQLNDMERYYSGIAFQTDRFICSGKRTVWSPRFTYHGFRYAEIEGIRIDEENTACAVCAHQAVESRTEFWCSDEFLNRLFEAGKESTLSNMFYMMTDCPTREKLGWANDAQASMEQILTDFKAEKVMEKWLQDVYDAMREDGALPGIIPTPGWGYEWGNGPVSDGLLFEIPYRIYLHTGNSKLLISSLPYFARYFAYLESRTDADGFVRFGLPDWAAPGSLLEDKMPEVPVEFSNALLAAQFHEIAALAAGLAGEEKLRKLYAEKGIRLKELVRSHYIDNIGRCKIDKQTAVAMLIYHEVTEDVRPLKEQLMELIEEKEFHHDCGMVGLRRLYMALNKCGLQEYAFRIITAEGYPGYRTWFDREATTLWEHWDYEKAADSKNHHMYSDVLSWMVKTILGIRMELEVPAFREVCIDPYFFEQLEFAEGRYETCNGEIAVSWRRRNEASENTGKAEATVELKIRIPEGMSASFRGVRLRAGENRLFVPVSREGDSRWNRTKW